MPTHTNYRVIGAARHLVAVQVAATVPDGDGGTIETWGTVDPPWPVAIRPARARDLERRQTSTTLAPMSHVLTGRYRSDVTLDARIVWAGRIFTVTGVSDPEERGIVLEVAVRELV